MLRKAKDVIASGDIAAVIDYGIEIDRSVKAEVRELEEVKAFLRGKGQTQAGSQVSERKVELSGNLGIVTVVYPGPAVKVRRGVDLLACEKGMDSTVFNALFRKEVFLSEGFLAKLAKLSASERAMVLNLVEIGVGTPRVAFP